MSGIGLAIWIAVIVFGVANSIRRSTRRSRVPVAQPVPQAPPPPRAPAPQMAFAPTVAVMAPPPPVPAPPAPRPAPRPQPAAPAPVHSEPHEVRVEKRSLPGFRSVSGLRAAVIASTVLGEPRAVREYQGPGL
ncbi:MAG: hypothetical protein ACLQPV_06255 [Vulcanimicrobiaceae bacterium]